MRLRSHPILLCGRQQAEQTRDGRVTPVCRHEDALLQTDRSRWRVSSLPDRADRSNRLSFPNVGARFARSGKEDGIQDAARDGDLPARRIGEGIRERASRERREIRPGEPGMRRREDAFRDA